jgi:hypothetical protein
MWRFARRPSPALVIAVLALSMGLTGSSYAGPVRAEVSALITGKRIKDGTVTGRDVKNGSLLKADFRAGQLPVGPKGDPGAAGPQGVPGLAAVETVVSPEQTLLANQFKVIEVQCPDGKVAVGGGGSGDNGFVHLVGSEPVAGQGELATKWKTQLANDPGGIPSGIRAKVICARISN